MSLGGSWAVTLTFCDRTMEPLHLPPITFVCCVSNMSVLEQRLLASPCLADGQERLTAYFNADSAASAFNSAMQSAESNAWLVWVHQDVYLPRSWALDFKRRLAQAAQTFENLAVVGVYGLQGAAPHARRAGHVLDRGVVLRESAALPCLVDSLDELLFAVRVDSGLNLDPRLGFDFYATDLVLQAKDRGLQAAVVDAYCEHWSGTPSFGHIPQATQARIALNGSRFETKWAAKLPISTPCFDIHQVGDVQRAISHLVGLRSSE